jgi:hypothetical protein
MSILRFLGKVLAICTVASLLTLATVPFWANAQQTSLWMLTSSILKPVTRSNLSIRNLSSCDTIDADVNGVLRCGTDATGGAGGADYSKFSTSTETTSIYFNGTGNVGIGTTTPWAKLSVLSTNSLIPAFFVGTSTDYSSWGLSMFWDATVLTRGFWDIWIGGATTSQRYNKDDVAIFGAQNMDTSLVNMNDSISIGIPVIGADAQILSGANYDFILDTAFGETVVGTTTADVGGASGGATGVTNGCNDGGKWFYMRANTAVGAVANEGGWLRGSAVTDLRGTLTGNPAAVVGGNITSTGTPTMEVTICTPSVSVQAASSTTLMPALYAFGFGDTAFATAFMSSTIPAPVNGAFLAATGTDNWMLVNTDNNVGVMTSTGISTTTTRTAPTTFRLTMTATATYAWRFNHGTGGWESIGTQTTRQTKRDFTWFLGVQKPGVAAQRKDFLFRNLKVWHSPTYRF